MSRKFEMQNKFEQDENKHLNYFKGKENNQLFLDLY